MMEIAPLTVGMRSCLGIGKMRKNNDVVMY